MQQLLARLVMHPTAPIRDVFAIFSAYAASYAESSLRGDVDPSELQSAGDKVRILAEVVLAEPTASERDLLNRLQVIAFFAREQPWMVKNPIILDVTRTPYLQVLFGLAHLHLTNSCGGS